MKRIFAFEIKKLLTAHLLLIPLILIVLFLIHPILYHYDFAGAAERERINEETQAYWGMAVDEEMIRTVYQDLLDMGVTVLPDPLNRGPKYDLIDDYPLIEKYGLESEMHMRSIALQKLLWQPTLASEQQDLQDLIESQSLRLKEDPKKLAVFQRRAERMLACGPYEIAPVYSAWKYFLHLGDYGNLLCGLLICLAVAVILGPVFSVEASADLSWIVRAQPRIKLLTHAKLILSFVTGMLLTALLQGGYLLILGLLYGFQGAQVGALSCLGAEGYIYGMLYGDVTCLELSLIRLAFSCLGGGVLGLITAALSACVSRTLAGTALNLAGMAVLSLLPHIPGTMIRTNTALAEQWDMDRIHAMLLTPSRMFIQPELLLDPASEIASSFDIHFTTLNIMLYPELALLCLATLCLLGVAAYAAGMTFTGIQKH